MDGRVGKPRLSKQKSQRVCFSLPLALLFQFSRGLDGVRKPRLSMYSILIYFSFFLVLLLSILYPIANAGIRGISTLAIAVPSCTGDTPAIAHPPPPPDGAVVGVGVGDGAVVGVGDGAVVGVGVGVGGANASLFPNVSLIPSLL